MRIMVLGMAVATLLPIQAMASSGVGSSSGWVLACAAFNAALFLFHAAFWRLFRWPGSLGGSGRINTAITQVLNIMLAYCFLVAAAAFVWLYRSGGDARPLALAGAGFWLIRTVLQPLFFSMRNTASVAITGVFAVGFVLHLAAALR